MESYLEACWPVSCFCRCFLIAAKSGWCAEESISDWTTGVVVSVLSWDFKKSFMATKFMAGMAADAVTEITKVAIAKFIFFMDAFPCY